MKKFFAEFKKFISRGNVMDMAVGMIVGSAFTAIVTALSNGILKPIINWVIYLACGGDTEALSKMYTPLVKVFAKDGTLDLAKSVIIDWGAFISAIINFLLVAIVLFSIVKLFNKAKDASENWKESLKNNSPFTKEELKAMRKAGKTKAEIAAAEEERRAELAEQARIAEEEAKANAPKTTEQLLGEIVVLLQNK